MAPRATAAEVLKLFGGVYPPGVDATNIGNLLASADYAMDGYALKHFKTDLSTTDTAVIHASNMTVAQLGLRVLWYQAGGVLSGTPEPPVLTDEVIVIIEGSLSSTTNDGVYTGDQIDDEA